MCDEIIVTTTQWAEKIMPLSSKAHAAFSLVNLGYINQNTAAFARDAEPDEWDGMEWLQELGGMKPDATPEEREALSKEVIAELNTWLNA